MALRRYFGKISPLQIGNLVGHNGELVIDEATDKIYIMDGVTPGGHEIANVSANLNIEYTNVNPAIDVAYTLGNSTRKWSNLFVLDANILGNLYIEGNINPNDNTGNNRGNLNITAHKVAAYGIAFQNALDGPTANIGNLTVFNNFTVNGYTTVSTLAADQIRANNFIEISPTFYNGYLFSSQSGATGLVYSNVNNITAVSIVANGNPSLVTYGNGYNSINGYTQFYSNVFISGANLTIPNYTSIGLLPSFALSNAKLTYVDNVNNYSQFLLQNKNSGNNASGDLVVTADNGSDTTHFIDLGINSSTFTGGGGLDGPNDGYLLVEGGKLVIMTIDQPNDIVFAIGGDSPSNEIGRWKASNGLVVTGNITASGNVNIAGNLTVTGNILTTNYETISLTEYANNITASGNITASANVNAAFFVGNAYYVTGLTVYGNAQVATYLPTDSTIISLFSNAATQASNLASLASNAATQENEISLLNANVTAANANASTQATLINTINANIISANSAIATLQTQVYSNSNVSAYYVANTVATGNIQILSSGNIRLPTGGTINESAGSGTITLTPNTSASALAGVAIGGSGYLLAANNTRNAVLNYNSVNGQFGIYQVNVYGNQQNAIINGGAANNYGNIGGISSFFGNLFVANIYSQGFMYPNGTSILSGIGGTYSNSNVAAYLSTATAVTANLANVITSGGVFWANGVSYSSGGGSTYSNSNVAAYLPTYNGNIGNITTGNHTPLANIAYNLGNSTLYWSNAYASNFNALTQIATPKIQFTVGGASILEDNALDLAITGPYQISVKPGFYQYTFNNNGSLSGPGGTIAWANGAIGGNVIATGVYWSNGVAFSSGGGTYGNTQVGYYLNSNVITSNITIQGNINTIGNIFANTITATNTFNVGNITTTGTAGNLTGSGYVVAGNLVANTNVYANGFYWLNNGAAFSSGGGSTYSNTNVAAYLPTYAGNVNANFYLGNGYYLTGITGGGSTYSNTNVAAYLVTYNGNISAGNLSLTSGASGNISGTGYVVAGNMVANTGVYGNSFYWYNNNATLASTITGTFANANVAGYLPTYTGNVGAGNIILTNLGNIIAATNSNLSIRTYGVYNILTLSGIAGGYNSPPYTNQSLTGGSGSGMLASYSSVGGYISTITVTNPGTGYKNGDVLTVPGGLGSTVTLSNYNQNITTSKAYNWTFSTYDGNVTVPGNIIMPSNSYVLGDFTNSTFAYRTAFQTTTANATTGIYALPSGTSTGASWQAVANSNPNNASKIFMATNSNVDVQLGSGINGSGTYLPLSLYNNNAAQMIIYPNGNVYMSNANPITTTGNVSVGNLVTTGNVTANYIVTTGSYGNISGANVITANTFIGTNGTISGNLYSPSQTGKSAAIVAQNTAVTMDNIKVQWLNNGSGNANQLQIGSLSGTPSILYTYVFQSGLGGGTTGGSSSTSLSTTYANIGSTSGTAGDMYMVTATVGTNAYRVSAITGSGYSNNLISIERLV